MHKKAAQATAAKERKASKAKNLNTSGDVSMDGLNNTNNSNDSFDAFESSMQMDSAFQPKRSFSQISNSFSSQWQVDGMPAKPEKSKKPKGSYFNKFSDSDSDNDVEPLSIPDQPRDQPPRRGTQQKKLPKYTEDSDDDDLEEISNDDGQEKISRMLKSTQSAAKRSSASLKAPASTEQDDVIEEVELT